VTIIAERGLFVRLLVQSGKFEQSQAEALADTLDATTREPATRGDLTEVRGDISELRAELRGDISELRAELRGDISELRAELRGEAGQLRTEMRSGDALLAQQMAAQTDKILVRLGGLMIALIGMLFAALRLT
jgi:tRNA U34 5-carboxymethylaminomethyl modifying GTPase MnmE/TrmE